MQKNMSVRLLAFLLLFSRLAALSASLPDLGISVRDTLAARPWRAAGEVFLVNGTVWAFDRYVMREDFARISGRSINHNLHHGVVWDNDRFSTNFFAHPFHGSLYFNAARSNGMNFWHSFPYALGGSLMWELACETEPPAVNDLIATSVGGAALGEATHRMAALLFDSSRRGVARVWREALGTILSPVDGLNRLLSGSMWHVSPRRPNDCFHTTPLELTACVGMRCLADGTRFFRDGCSFCMDFSLRYGDAFRGSTVPYDYFSFGIGLGLSAGQPLINRIRLTGNLWSTAVEGCGDMEAVFGIYQYFNYYDSEEVIQGSGRIPYKISEVASVGPGLLCRIPQVGCLRNIEHHLYLGGILLGGCLTDHYRAIDRDYNMGSGYSLRSHTCLDFSGRVSLSLDLHHLRLYTWQGYAPADLYAGNLLYLNAQGDAGNVSFTLIRPSLSIALRPHLHLSVETTCFLRYTHYLRHRDVTSTTLETKFGVRYGF